MDSTRTDRRGSRARPRKRAWLRTTLLTAGIGAALLAWTFIQRDTPSARLRAASHGQAGAKQQSPMQQSPSQQAPNHAPLGADVPFTESADGDGPFQAPLSADSPGVESPEYEDMEMVPAAQPPASPPPASFQGTAIPMASMEWMIDGRMESSYPDESFTVADIPHVSLDTSAPATFDIGSPVLPMAVTTQVYTQVGADGVPTGKPTVTQCSYSREGAPCRIRPGEKSVRVEVDLPRGARVLTVMAHYAIPSGGAPADGPVEEDYVSWSLYIKP